MILITFKNFQFIIGKNQDENQQIIDESQPDDYWLHLSNFSSPHLIIKNPNNIKINNKILKQAAYQLKIHSNSKCRKINNISIDIAKIKHLHNTDTNGTVIFDKIIKNITI